MEDIKFNKKKRKADNEISPKEKEDKQQEEKNRKNEQGWKNMVDFTKGLSNPKFEFYYKTQLAEYFTNNGTFDQVQWENFLAKLKEKLPCVFRVSKAHLFKKRFMEILLDDKLLPSLIGGTEAAPLTIKVKNLINFPEWKDLIYTINIPRMELKKSESLAKFHKFIQYSVDSGIISRQEAVSMIPPMLMQPQRHDAIFDMCAAPGSKTAQFLEVFYEDFDFLNKDSIKKDTGFVLANDNNPKRAYMMVHQLKRLNTAGMIVVSHDAQFFPTIYETQGENDNENKRVLFNKILADVPCSSDAVMRKLPHKWKNWSTGDSFSLHKLQVQILRRGINLLKVGGLIVYSTCSLNPIENEAVVASIMKSYSNELEIVDMTYAFDNTDIKPHHGLLSWEVFVEDKKDKTKLIKIPDSSSELYSQYKDTIDETCFCLGPSLNEKYGLKNCIRLFPHDSDTSGFFITVIKKKAPLVVNEKQRNKTAGEARLFEFLAEKYPDESNWVKNYYGIEDDFPMEQLVTQSGLAKKISFVSKGVYNLLKNDSRNQLKLQNAGVKLFKRNKAKSNDEEYCLYRVCQDGLMYILPFMTKRIYYTTTEFFKELLTKKDIKHDDIKEESLKKLFKEVKPGCLVLINVKNLPGEKFDRNEFLKENFIDAICCYNANTRITTMINKEHQHVFNLKYDIKN